MDTVTLDRVARACRHGVIAAAAGREVLLDLGRTAWLADGDALSLEGWRPGDPRCG